MPPPGQLAPHAGLRHGQKIDKRVLRGNLVDSQLQGIVGPAPSQTFLLCLA